MTPPDDVSTRLDSIRERVEAATEGPWKVYENRHLLKVRHSDDAATNGQVCKVAEFPIEWQRKNAEWIASARSDVPYLLSRLEEVGEALAAMHDYDFEALQEIVTQDADAESADTLAVLRDAAQEGAE